MTNTGGLSQLLNKRPTYERLSPYHFITLSPAAQNAFRD